MLKKLVFKPGVNTENSRYFTESGWWESNLIRFRQGTPQTVGGWNPISPYTYVGICRSLWNWVTLGGIVLTGVGTSKKFYVMQGGQYYDVTPIRRQATLSNPFTASNGSAVITVTDAGHGCVDGDYVTFYGATGLGGNITASILNNTEYQITYINANSYSITAAIAANGSDTGHGGTVSAVYLLNVGTDTVTAVTGWGAGGWGSGTWGYSSTSTTSIRLWSQTNFGEDLVFGPRGGGMYYYNSSYGLLPISASMTIASPAVVSATNSFIEGDVITFTTSGSLPTGVTAGVNYYVRSPTATTFNLSATPTGSLINTSGTQSGDHAISIRAANLANMAGASYVPTVQNFIMVSDIYRFVFAFGCNDYGETAQSPLMIRWSDQEDPTNWDPTTPTSSQAGSLQLSRGSEIITALQTRQEVVVWTDTSVYVLQFLGAPLVWGAQLIGDNVSIINQNATATAANVVYWMGVDKFYKYDGRVQTLRCDLLAHVFNDINLDQSAQICAGTVERFNEIWWFYPSSDSTVNDKYVVYNYIEDIWYYGALARTAWIDSGILDYPIAATYHNNVVLHENGLDDNETGIASPLDAYISSSEFDLDPDGHNFMFIRRILPDITFRGSTTVSPTVTMTVRPLKNSGSGYTTPPSVGGSDNADVVRTTTVPIEEFTGQVFIRVRGRQMSFKIESYQLGCAWQLGAPRLDLQTDGRK